MARTLADAHRAFAELQGAAVEAVNVHAAPNVRRLDLEALRAAARRLGHADVRAALVEACATTRPAHIARAAALAIIAGEVPGSITRTTVARFFGVDERELWPVDGGRGGF